MRLSMWRRSVFVLAALTTLGGAASVQAQNKPAGQAGCCPGATDRFPGVCGLPHCRRQLDHRRSNPILAQQHAQYLVKQLMDYTVRPGEKAPARENSIMNGMASHLVGAGPARCRGLVFESVGQARRQHEQGHPRARPTHLAGRDPGEGAAGVQRLPQPDGRRHSGAVPAACGPACRVHRGHAEEVPRRRPPQQCPDAADRRPPDRRRNACRCRLRPGPAQVRSRGVPAAAGRPELAAGPAEDFVQLAASRARTSSVSTVP